MALRGKILERGAAVLSDQELLALILGFSGIVISFRLFSRAGPRYRSLKFTSTLNSSKNIPCNLLGIISVMRHSIPHQLAHADAEFIICL